jgi:serine/threonine protein kinase
MSSGSPEPTLSRIGRYRIICHLKTGGMAKVYKAEDTETGRAVALKVLTAESASNPRRLERFRREAKQGARLRHENIVSLYEYGEADGMLFLALEFVDGVDVEELIRIHGPLRVQDARSIITQIARALDYAHSMGTVHRDIKPSNMLITRRHGRCVAKLADLGLARGGIEEESRVTRDGSTVGTVDYIAPEQARSSDAADIRSDIYSLGCSLYHMLSGEPPFNEGSIIQRLMQHSKVEPADLREINAEVTDELWAICRRMLAKQRAQRYQTPAELLADLAHAAPGPDKTSSLWPTKVDVPTKLLKGAAQEEATSAALSLEARLSGDLKVAPPTPEDEARRIVERQFEHAVHAIAIGNYDYGLTLLLNCCRVEPGNVSFHQALLQAHQGRHASSGGASRAWFGTWTLRLRHRFAQKFGDPMRVLDYARKLLACTPDDLITQLDMADAARAAGFADLAIWMLETVLAAHPENDRAMRTLADLMEDQGDMHRALGLWEMIAAQDGDDPVANRKVRDLAASVMSGKYYADRKAKRAGRGSSFIS